MHTDYRNRIKLAKILSYKQHKTCRPGGEGTVFLDSKTEFSFCFRYGATSESLKFKVISHSI